MAILCVRPQDIQPGEINNGRKKFIVILYIIVYCGVMGETDTMDVYVCVGNKKALNNEYIEIDYSEIFENSKLCDCGSELNNDTARVVLKAIARASEKSSATDIETVHMLCIVKTECKKCGKEYIMESTQSIEEQIQTEFSDCKYRMCKTFDKYLSRIDIDKQYELKYVRRDYTPTTKDELAQVDTTTDLNSEPIPKPILF